MPKLSWNEIHQRAVRFSQDWAEASSERGDKQTFWNEFFAVFGLARKQIATFEERVRRLPGKYGYIDLLWKTNVLVEHKSAGESLEAAETQAFDYLHDLQAEGRSDELPRYILLSDFRRFALYDLEPEEQLDLPMFRERRFTRLEFTLAEFPQHLREFAWVAGYQISTAKPQDPLNLKATEIMGRVHDALKANGYAGHELERLLVRVLFCLFAQDTGLFEPEAFRLYIENRTAADGSDLGVRLEALFQTLDTPESERQRNLDESLKEFRYVNGELFRERLTFAAFDMATRNALLAAAGFNWARISPAIFGALFQEVMKPVERRKIGAHYTSERDILKVTDPLFMDGLRGEFEAIDRDRSGRRPGRLEMFRGKLRGLKFLDPACGCGNFLVIAYRELRGLELRALVAQYGGQQALSLDQISGLSKVDVDQFYGIEIEEWPARIAEVALWLTDHQANQRVLEAFGEIYDRLPLKASPHIRVANALRMDWNELLPVGECSYVLGNPPFVGKSFMSAAQKEDMQLVLKAAGGIAGAGVLDYVTAWYLTAARYIDRTPIEVCFVSTNSISQGEQPGILWNYLFRDYKVQINLAYQTFAWTSEARGKAHVHVVIIGFAGFGRTTKVLYLSDMAAAKVIATPVLNISPYLVEGPDVALLPRSTPLCDVPRAQYGSKPVDDGNLILNEQERGEILALEPDLAPYIRTMVGAEEYIWGIPRWCFWLEGVSPSIIANSATLLARVRAVRAFRLKSKKLPTREAASRPSLFSEPRQPKSRYIVLPLVTSETRRYIPIGFFEPSVVISNLCTAIPGATLFHFGVLNSAMHMAWVKVVAGRLESRFRYSNTLVYNNYPWPQHARNIQLRRVEELAEGVLEARRLHPGDSLGYLYNPVLMPPELVRAHGRLDRAVERCYRAEPFGSDRERVEFLFRLYEEWTAPLLPVERRRGQKGNRKKDNRQEE